jgi:hypothetical protein
MGEPLALFAEREKRLETPSGEEISSLYFTSEQEMFTLRLSVSTAAGKNGSTSQIITVEAQFSQMILLPNL